MVLAEIVAHECLGHPHHAAAHALPRPGASADDAWAGRCSKRSPGAAGCPASDADQPPEPCGIAGDDAPGGLAEPVGPARPWSPTARCWPARRPAVAASEATCRATCPTASLELRLGDQLLFAGTEEARRDLGMTPSTATPCSSSSPAATCRGDDWEWLAQRQEVSGGVSAGNPGSRPGSVTGLCA